MKHKILCIWVIIALLMSGIVIPASAGEAPAPRSSVGQSVDDSENSLAQAYGSTDYRSNPPGELLIADAIILRPFGVIACAIGFVSASFLTLPWASSSDSFDRVESELIRKPFEYTIKRPLGDLDY